MALLFSDTLTICQAELLSIQYWLPHHPSLKLGGANLN